MEYMKVVFRGTDEALKQYYEDHILPVFMAGGDCEAVFVTRGREAVETVEEESE